jgi:hypothetical protein
LNKGPLQEELETDLWFLTTNKYQKTRPVGSLGVILVSLQTRARRIWEKKGDRSWDFLGTVSLANYQLYRDTKIFKFEEDDAPDVDTPVPQEP